MLSSRARVPSKKIVTTTSTHARNANDVSRQWTGRVYPFSFQRGLCLSCFLEFLEQKPSKPVGEWLVLDEAHVIKNSESRSYHAISALRSHFHGCLMMTGTPLDNKWEDGYALLSLLRGHPLLSSLLFKAAFLKSLSSGSSYPEDYHKARYIQVLDATSLGRPMDCIKDMFPHINNTVVVMFPLDPEDRQRSNEAFKKFKKAMRPIDDVREKDAGWKHLVTANQYAYHRMLVELSMLHGHILASFLLFQV
ncbi:hypothetical protein ACHAP5_005373, partial [Fusarium lateritium]